jgi:hypothetical protein
MATPNTSEFLVVPINGTDLIAFFRGSNISRPLYLRYSTFLDILSQSIGGGTTLLLETNGVQNPSQTLLNLIQGSGITITDNGTGGVTIAATGGASFITSISDTADIDLDVTLSDLSASLTTTGVTPNTYGSATQVPQITVDSKGRITSVTLVNITAGTGSVTSVTAGTGLTATASNPITVSGTIQLNSKLSPADNLTGNALKYLRVNAGETAVEYATVTGAGTVTNVSATVPSPANPAFTVTVPNPTTTPSVDITANGIVSQYIRGDGSLANFPSSTGGGSSVSYYLNGSVNQGTFGGSTYYEMSKTPILGGGTTFTRLNSAGNGLIAQFITDAGDPNLLSIPGGNWNIELFLRASSVGGSPSYYVELYKYDGATFTLIATDSATPEGITNGTTLDAYFTALAVPTTTLALTDRIALRVFVNTSGRTIELHTENGHLCQIITTFTTGITALNGLTDQVQNFATPGTTGTAPNWNSVSPTHTLNIPLASTASVTAGLLSNAEYTTFTKGSAGVIFDGAGGVITTNTIGYVQVPYNGTITGWTLVSSVSGSCTVTAFKDTYGAFPPTTTTDDIFVTPPAISATNKAQNLAAPTIGLFGTVTAGDWIGFRITGVSTVAWVNLTLSITKTI